MKNPTVSIVIPTFNRSKFVQEAIDSSLNQTYPCEIIVCDHGSTDDTPKVMKKYGNKITYIRREKDFGPHFCWLEGILNATGEYVHLQFDDDWIEPSFIEECMKLINKDVGVVISEGKMSELGIAFDFKKKFKKNGIYPRKKIEKEVMRGVMYTPCASLFRKKDLIDALYQGDLPIMKYKSYHGVGPDSFMTLLALLRYKKVGIIIEPLVYFRGHETSITSKAHKSPETYFGLKNAYENVINYYMFLKKYKLFDKLKYFNFGFWKRNSKLLAKKFLDKIGLYSKLKKIYGKRKLEKLKSNK